MWSGRLFLKSCRDDCGAGHLPLARPVASVRQGYGNTFAGQVCRRGHAARCRVGILPAPSRERDAPGTAGGTPTLQSWRSADLLFRSAVLCRHTCVAVSSRTVSALRVNRLRASPGHNRGIECKAGGPKKQVRATPAPERIRVFVKAAFTQDLD